MTTTEKQKTNKTPQQQRTRYLNDWAQFLRQNTNAIKTPPISPKTTPVRTQMTASPIRTQYNKTIQKTPPPTKTKTKQYQMTATKTKTNKTTATKTKKTIKTNQNTKYANHPDYEYDTVKTRWVKKSDLRPAELVNRYKAFLTEFLKKQSKIPEKEIKTLVKKHATSSERLKEELKWRPIPDYMVNKLIRESSFWKKELCKHMENICPTPKDIKDIKWCDYEEHFFFYYKDEQTQKGSCYSIGDILSIISTSLTGGDEELILLQLPRDPYTRKVLSEKFMKAFLKQLRILKNFEIQWPHVVYFLRNYKKFYHDPAIKPFLKKNTFTNEEKWELSDEIEEFMTRTNEIEHGWTTDNKRWWFWVDEKNQPKSKYDYIFKQ